MKLWRLDLCMLQAMTAKSASEAFARRKDPDAVPPSCFAHHFNKG